MKSIFKIIEDFIINNDLWLYLALILGASYFFMQTSHDLGWIYFTSWIVAFSFLFFSVLLFSFFRRKLQQKVNKYVYWGIWLFASVLVPIVMQMLAINSNLFNGIEKQLNYSLIKNLDIILGFMLPAFIILEFLLYFSKNSFKNNKISKKITPTFLVLAGFTLLIALITLSSNEFQNDSAVDSKLMVFVIWFSQFIQYFIIYSFYFIYYYVNHHFLYNKILKHRGPIVYLLSLFALLLILTPVINFFILQFPIISQTSLHTLSHSESIFDDLNYFLPVIILILTFPLIIFIELNKKEKMLSVLQKEKTGAELSMLKQQINPHFFFNTLNNLYALSLEQAKETPDTILKLSELMRYVIYKGEQDQVLLTEEVKYIQDYIDLQKIRFHKKVDFSFEVTGNLSNTSIAPLMLIVLVENAFKHGIEPAESDIFLHLKLEVNSDQLVFTCINGVDNVELNEIRKGIGIANLKKRLDILYPNRHNLLLDQKTDKFLAILSLDL